MSTFEICIIAFGLLLLWISAVERLSKVLTDEQAWTTGRTIIVLGLSLIAILLAGFVHIMFILSLFRLY